MLEIWNTILYFDMVDMSTKDFKTWTWKLKQKHENSMWSSLNWNSYTWMSILMTPVQTSMDTTGVYSPRWTMIDSSRELGIHALNRPLIYAQYIVFI